MEVPLRFSSWLDKTKQVQEEVFGYDFDKMQAVRRMQTEYIMWNLFADYQESAELAVEFSWKPWATDEPFINRERVLDEAVDKLHFIGNILSAIGVNDDELNRAYEKKVNLNIQRKMSGKYTARKGGLGDGSDSG